MTPQRLPGSRLERRRRQARERRLAPFRMSPLQVYVGAWLFLAGAVGAIVLAQLTASRSAPWISIGYSAGAVVLTVAAVLRRPRAGDPEPLSQGAPDEPEPLIARSPAAAALQPGESRVP